MIMMCFSGAVHPCVCDDPGADQGPHAPSAAPRGRRAPHQRRAALQRALALPLPGLAPHGGRGSCLLQGEWPRMEDGAHVYFKVSGRAWRMGLMSTLRYLTILKHSINFLPDLFQIYTWWP